MQHSCVPLCHASCAGARRCALFGAGDGAEAGVAAFREAEQLGAFTDGTSLLLAILLDLLCAQNGSKPPIANRFQPCRDIRLAAQPALSCRPRHRCQAVLGRRRRQQFPGSGLARASPFTQPITMGARPLGRVARKPRRRRASRDRAQHFSRGRQGQGRRRGRRARAAGGRHASDCRRLWYVAMPCACSLHAGPFPRAWQR